MPCPLPSELMTDDDACVDSYCESPNCFEEAPEDLTSKELPWYCYRRMYLYSSLQSQIPGLTTLTDVCQHTVRGFRDCNLKAQAPWDLCEDHIRMQQSRSPHQQHRYYFPRCEVADCPYLQIPGSTVCAEHKCSFCASPALRNGLCASHQPCSVQGCTALKTITPDGTVEDFCAEHRVCNSRGCRVVVARHERFCSNHRCNASRCQNRRDDLIKPGNHWCRFRKCPDDGDEQVSFFSSLLTPPC